MQEGPGRRLAIGQGGGVVFRDAGGAQRLSRRARGGIKTWAQAVDDHDGHQPGYAAPLLPAVKTPQIVRAHDPDEVDAGAPGDQPFYRAVSISRFNDSFDTCLLYTSPSPR